MVFDYADIGPIEQAGREQIVPASRRNPWMLERLGIVKIYPARCRPAGRMGGIGSPVPLRELPSTPPLGPEV